MNLSESAAKRLSLLPKYIALSLITLYSASLFLPVLFRIITPVGNMIIVFAALVCMLLDQHTESDTKKTAVIKYAFAGLLMLYLWWIGMKEIISLENYMAHSLLLWVSVPFFIYLRSNNSHMSRHVLISAILVCMTITCITTLANISKYPEAPRMLAAGGEASRAYSWMNIGGYGFVYSLALATPIVFSVLFSSYSLWIRIMAIILTGLFGWTILLTQYFMAFYMWLLGTSIVIIYNVINKVERHILKKSRSTISMALAILIVLAIFTGFMFEINSAVNQLFSALNLTVLTGKIASIDELQEDVSIAIMEQQSSVVESSIDESQGDTPIAITEQQASMVESSVDQPQKDASIALIEQQSSEAENINAGNLEINNGNSFVQNIIANRNPNDPLSSRLSHYFSVIDGVQNHWLTGNLLSTNYSLSFHSDILDAFLGGGILGAALVSLLLFGILRKLFRISLNEQLRPYFLLVLLMLLGLGLVNTIFLSREILYIYFILLAVSLAPPIRENTRATAKEKLNNPGEYHYNEE